MLTKTWKVYDIKTKEYVFTGTRQEIGIFINHPSLLSGDRIQEGRIYEGRYTMELCGDPYEDILFNKRGYRKTEPLPSWAKGKRSWYNKIVEIRSSLLQSGTFGLGYEDDGKEYIRPLKLMGTDVKVRKIKRIDGKGYFDMLELVR